MEKIEELTGNMQSEIVDEVLSAVENAVGETVENTLSGVLENTLEEALENVLDNAVQDAVASALQGFSDDKTAKDRLYVMSQNKKMLAPITYAKVQNSNGKNPKSAEFPFVITARIGIYANEVFGWYRDENSAIDELKNICEAMKKADKNRYSVYEMN